MTDRTVDEPQANGPLPARVTPTARLVGFADRRPYLTVGLVAFALRGIVAAGLFAFGIEVAPDASRYWRRAGEFAGGNLDVAIGDQRRGFIYFLAPFHLLSGGSQLAGQLAVAAVGAAAAVVTAVLGTELTGSRRVGLLAGLLVAVWPSQVIFSAITLRDALIWTALVAIALVVHRAAERTFGLAHLGYGLAVVALLYLLAILKPSTMIVAAGALVVAAVVVPHGSRLAKAGVAVALVLVVPLAAGWGLAGTERFTPERVVSSIESRTDSSAHACTFIDHPQVTGPSDIAVRLARGVPATVAGPYPWTETCSLWGEVAKIESALFVVLLVIAVLGAARIERVWRRLPYGLALAFGLLLVNGVAQGAIGTAFRHRAEVFWLVAILAATWLVDQYGSVRRTSA